MGDYEELRRLDVEIHTRVMGQPLEGRLVGDGRSMETAFRVEPETAAWRIRSSADEYWHRLSPDGADKVVIAPAYSSSIEAAMRVVEKMWQVGWQVEIANSYKINTLITDNVCVWWVRFINNENDMDNWSAEADSLPEAICRAALKAMENQS